LAQVNVVKILKSNFYVKRIKIKNFLKLTT